MDLAGRLARELAETTARLRHGANVAVLDDEGPAGADAKSFINAIDHVQRSTEREMTLATQSRLRERAHRLAGALERLREGRYGTCEECGAQIAAARLAALPEVTTCLPCQRRRELAVSRGAVDAVSLFPDAD